MAFPAANESQAIAKWLYATMAAYAGLTSLVSTRIYDTLAAQESSLPCVVYSMHGGIATHATGGCGRILEQEDWFVKGIAEGGGYAEADSIAKQIDGAINGQSGTTVVDGVTYTVHGVLADEPVRYLENNEGRRIHHSGRVYRILVRAEA